MTGRRSTRSGVKPEFSPSSLNSHCVHPWASWIAPCAAATRKAKPPRARVNPQLTKTERQPTVEGMAESAPDPTPVTHPVRLDELINAINQVHTDVLDRLSDALLAAEHLGEVADHLIGHFVDQARRSGASWTDIGKSMGVTKQAAQQRFVPKEPATPSGLDPSQGFPENKEGI